MPFDNYQMNLGTNGATNKVAPKMLEPFHSFNNALTYLTYRRTVKHQSEIGDYFSCCEGRLLHDTGN